MCHWTKDRYIGQQNRKEGPEMDPHIHDKLICDKGAEVIQQEKASFSINDAQQLSSTCKKINPDPINSMVPEVDSWEPWL